MSNTQQEIATPKVCKKRFSPLISGTIALIFVSFSALGLIAAGLMLLTDNAVMTILVVIVLSVALAAAASVAFKDRRVVVKLILDAVTAEIAVIIIGRFISTMTAANSVTSLIYIATTAVMAIILISINVIKLEDKPKDTRRSTRYLTYAATFVALSVIFKMLGNTVSSIVIIPNMRLSFVYIPWVISGIVLGPIGGVLTALISDVLGQLTIAVGGAINPLTMLSNALFPLAPALIFKFAKKAPQWLKLLGGMLISLVVCTMGIGSAALFWQYEYYSSMSFLTYLATIRSPQMLIIAINFFLCLLLMPVVNKMTIDKRLKEVQTVSN